MLCYFVIWLKGYCLPPLKTNGVNASSLLALENFEEDFGGRLVITILSIYSGFMMEYGIIIRNSLNLILLLSSQEWWYAKSIPTKWRFIEKLFLLNISRIQVFLCAWRSDNFNLSFPFFLNFRPLILKNSLYF